MKVIAALVTCLGAASAFAPAAVSNSRNVAIAASSLDSEFGVSIETGNRCPPLGAKILEDSNPAGIKWFQNAEIKHGRVAMVATIGFMVQKFGVHFPLYFGPTGSNAFHPGSDDAWLLSTTTGVSFSEIAAASPLDAIGMVPTAGWVQILFISGWFESLAFERQWNQENNVPGDYGYDPLGFTKDQGLESDKMKKLRMKEIKNGRVAM